MHDIGNCVNRTEYAHTGVLLAYNILNDLGMSPESRTEIMMAIGTHNEKTPGIVSDISAALILADKSDVYKNEISNKNLYTCNINDRVNYAVSNSDLIIDEGNRKARLELSIDTKICTVLDYFEMFMDSAMMCKYAAKYLNIEFELVINDTKLL